MKTPAPRPTGEYAVGTSTFSVYDLQKETFPGYENEMRCVSARLFYPVLKESVKGLKRERYMSPELAKGLQKAFKVPLKYEKLEASGENVMECYRDAPKIEGKKFPLIVFNHGYLSYREGNSFLCIELASHGYAVLSVAHSREALVMELDDGRKIESAKKLASTTYKPFLRGVLAAVRLTKMKGTNEERAAAFDVFQNKYCSLIMKRVGVWENDVDAAISSAKELYSDRIDFDMGIGVSGHSMGGVTAFALCLHRDDVVCGVNMDGGLFGDYGTEMMEKPFMQISTEANENIVARAYLYHSQPVYKVLIKGVTHACLSDMKHMVSIKMIAGKTPADVAHENHCRAQLEFFDAFLAHKKTTPELHSNDVVEVTVFP